MYALGSGWGVPPKAYFCVHWYGVVAAIACTLLKKIDYEFIDS